MSMIEQVWEKARRNRKRIVLPEGEDARTLQAAVRIKAEGIAEPILLGNEEKLLAALRSSGAEGKSIQVIDPASSPKAEEYANLLYDLRQSKGLTREQAAALVADPMYYGILMVKSEDADGLVSGAVHTTGDMLRPALQIIKTRPGIRIVSSSFLMNCPNQALGENGLLVYADCVVVPNPTAEELAQIAVSAAETARVLCGMEEPRVAMLSFSTKGSAKHELVEKVRQATEIAHSLAPDLMLDGEMQLDAALVPEVGRSKAPGSPVAGRANVLIFPDLQSGNIGYKITQRIAGAECYAVLQGLAKPCNDLSRGCSVLDIVNTVALTAVQAGA
ncbi:MAG: phosphate acetyltransferase [Clostridia bacterium]|nr:phosphate acetyltransferase [Clostridia bacterium]